MVQIILDSIENR